MGDVYTQPVKPTFEPVSGWVLVNTKTKKVMWNTFRTQRNLSAAWKKGLGKEWTTKRATMMVTP